MADPHALADTPELQALHARLAEYSLAGHWQPRQSNPPLVPHLWPWAVIYSCLMESGEVVKLGGVDDAAKRRTVQLVNPALTARKATSRTLQMSIQLVKPGERAECHRHTMAALVQRGKLPRRVAQLEVVGLPRSRDRGRGFQEHFRTGAVIGKNTARV